MNPLDVLRDLGQNLLGNAQSGLRKTLQRTLAGAIAGHVNASYPDPAAFDQAIATGSITLEQMWSTIPADALAAFRIVPGVAGVVQSATKEDWRAVLAWLGAPEQADGFGLPEHMLVLMRRWHWFCAQMESARGLFLMR